MLVFEAVLYAEQSVLQGELNIGFTIMQEL